MSSKLNDIFCVDNKVAERGIKKIVNTAYERQWCSTCQHSYYKNNFQRCSISKHLNDTRKWSPNDDSEQYCLFYKTRRKTND